jgi:hypothetical protein
MFHRNVSPLMFHLIHEAEYKLRSPRSAIHMCTVDSGDRQHYATTKPQRVLYQQYKHSHICTLTRRRAAHHSSCA